LSRPTRSCSGGFGPSESKVYSAFARGAITAASGEFADLVGGMVEMRGWGAGSPNGDRSDVHCLCYIAGPGAERAGGGDTLGR